MIEIRQATIEDIPAIMKFIGEHWKPNHIFSYNREFFEWQFVEDGQVYIILGVDDAAGVIYGMMGIIPYSYGGEPLDTSGTIWKTIKSDRVMLGMDMEVFAYEHFHIRHSFESGLSRKACRIYTYYDLKPVRLIHYYRLADRSDYLIAAIKNKIIPEVQDTGYRLAPVGSVDEMKEIFSPERLRAGLLSKDYHYIRKRYFDHPVYHYDIWSIVPDEAAPGKEGSILITRTEEAQGRRMGKIVDFYGEEDDLGRIGHALDLLMDEMDYEFVDVYSYGIKAETYEKAGMVERKEDDENIIPNYFHPYDQKNVELWMIEPLFEGLRMFRGDGDQDRPS